MDRLSPFFQGRGQFTYDQSNNSNNVSNQGFVSTQVVQTNYKQQGTISNTARATASIDPVKTVVADNTPTNPARVAQTFPPKVSTQTYQAKVSTQTSPAKE
mgnify:FL=1